MILKFFFTTEVEGVFFLFPFIGVLFTQNIPNEITLLRMDYDIALR